MSNLPSIKQEIKTIVTVCFMTWISISKTRSSIYKQEWTCLIKKICYLKKCCSVEIADKFSKAKNKTIQAKPILVIVIIAKADWKFDDIYF